MIPLLIAALLDACGYAGGQHAALLAGGDSSGLVLLAAVTLTAMLAAALAVSVTASAAAAFAIPLGRRAAALREKSWCAAFLPQRDPDARGRPRPRAPSAVPAAA